LAEQNDVQQLHTHPDLAFSPFPNSDSMHKDDVMLVNTNRRTCMCAVVALLAASFLKMDALAQSGTRTKTQANQSNVSTASGAVVVELFTSQGCSSCPPADAALMQIASTAKTRDLPVYVLSFHVDYWNRLGWKDPYSSPDYSNRQRAYAKATGSSRIYTPQMIVGGKTEFVGSDKAKAHATITKLLDQPQQSKVILDLVKGSTDGGSNANRVTAQYRITGLVEGLLLNVALVQTSKPNMVPEGENAGRELSHVNVVRSFEYITLTQATGSVELTLPNDFDASTAMIIAYVQDPRSLAVTGAVSAKL
jgi:hypothetical protein